MLCIWSFSASKYGCRSTSGVCFPQAICKKSPSFKGGLLWKSRGQSVHRNQLSSLPSVPWSHHVSINIFWADTYKSSSTSAVVMGDSCSLPPIPKRTRLTPTSIDHTNSSCSAYDIIFQLYFIIPIYVDIWWFILPTRALPKTTLM